MFDPLNTAGDSTPRPACIEANGLLSTFEAKLGSIMLSSGHDARVLLGENDRALQLDRGQVRISGGSLTTYVPLHQMKITGSNYGVWAEEDELVLAVIEGEVEVSHRGETTKYAAGREITYEGKKITPSGLESQFPINVSNEDKRRDERRITATVPTAAFVYKKTSSGYERVPINSAGKITVTLEGKATPGELVAFDASGRSASLGGTREAVKAKLEPETEGAPPPAPAVDPPREKKKKKRFPGSTDGE